MQHGVGRLVAGQRLFGQVLVGLCQTLHLSEASVESHGRVTGVLGHIEVRRPPQLLLNHQSLLQQLQSEGQEGRESDRDSSHSDTTNPFQSLNCFSLKSLFLI